MLASISNLRVKGIDFCVKYISNKLVWFEQCMGAVPVGCVSVCVPSLQYLMAKPEVEISQSPRRSAVGQADCVFR
jgi:hypothetical protein